MKSRRLGRSGIVVSEICMGTMTFGSQASESEAFEVLDRAYDAGIDFYDTAEMYPVPPDLKYAGRTEEIVGRWMKTKDRDSLIIASKVAGPSHIWIKAVQRAGKTGLDRHHIMRAVEGSLQRLQTDYLDLYQTHWPDPDMPHEETLYALDELVRSGKVRLIGCSNENAWGLMKSLSESERLGIARYETIQNNFSLNNRRFEDELANICRREGVSLLVYSPIAGGVLSGKYNDGQLPDGARFSNYLRAGQHRQRVMAERFVNERSLESTRRFQAIAQEAGVSVVTMAVAWSKQHDFVASSIVGANSVAQLDEILAATDLKLDDDTLKKIDVVSKDIRYPMG